MFKLGAPAVTEAPVDPVIPDPVDPVDPVEPTDPNYLGCFADLAIDRYCREHLQKTLTQTLCFKVFVALILRFSVVVYVARCFQPRPSP